MSKRSNKTTKDDVIRKLGSRWHQSQSTNPVKIQNDMAKGQTRDLHLSWADDEHRLAMGVALTIERDCSYLSQKHLSVGRHVSKGP